MKEFKKHRLNYMPNATQEDFDLIVQAIIFQSAEIQPGAFIRQTYIANAFYIMAYTRGDRSRFSMKSL